MSTQTKRTAMTREDMNVEKVARLYHDVTNHRGLGDSGRKVNIVERECEHPNCGYDRQVQILHINPEMKDGVEYRCQNPNCPDFHDGRLGIPY